MKSKLFFIILFSVLFFSSSINAYQKEDLLKIKLRQATNYERQNKFHIAEKIYIQLRSEFPHNFQVIEKMCTLYLRQKNFEKLNNILESEKKYLNDEFVSLTKIDIYLKKGELENAKKEANVLIRSKLENHSYYKKIAEKFTKNLYFDESIKFYKKARKISQKPDLYASEMALLYQYQMDFQSAIDEYLNMLDDKSFSLVKYRLDKLNVNSEIVIEAINNKLKKSENVLLKRLLGNYYLKNNNFDEAFLVFEKLGTSYLLNFAETCEKLGLSQLCIKSYESIITGSSSETQMLSIFGKIGDVYYRLQEYEFAYNYFIKFWELYEKTRIHFSQKTIRNVLIKLVKLELILHNSAENSERFLQKARQFTTNQNEMAQLSIALADCYLHTSKYVDAAAVLNTIIEKKHIFIEVKSKAKYKLYLSYIFSKNFEKADSIFTDFLNFDDENIYLNNIVAINDFIKHSTKFTDEFVGFLKSLNGLKTSEIKKKYDNLIKICENKDLVFIKIQMSAYYLQNKNYEKSLLIFLELSKIDEVGKYDEYIQKNIGDCYFYLKKYSLAKTAYKKYLINFPVGTFAPEVRNRFNLTD